MGLTTVQRYCAACDVHVNLFTRYYDRLSVYVVCNFPLSLSLFCLLLYVAEENLCP